MATQCLWWQRGGVMGGEVAGPPFLNGRKQRNLWHEVFLCPMFFILHRKYNIYITNAKYIYPHDAPWGNDASVPWYRAGFGAEGAAFRLSGSAVLHAFLGGEQVLAAQEYQKLKSFLETSQKLLMGVGFEPRFPPCPCPQTTSALLLNWPMVCPS